MENEFEEFKISSNVVFTNPDKLKENNQHPFDFGIITGINGLNYSVVVNDPESKYYGSKYTINEDNLAFRRPTDTLEDFEYVED